MAAASAALSDFPKSFLARAVSRVCLLAPAEERPPQHKRRPGVQDPVEGKAYVIDAMLAHRKEKKKGQGRSQ